MEERYTNGASYIEKEERLLSDFQAKVNSFCNEATECNITENVQSIREWADERKSDNDIQKIAEVGKVIETSITSLDDLTSGEPSRIIKGCLNIAQSVSSMIGGPYGAAASAICGILGAILSYSSPSQPDMATMLIQEVKREIQREFSKFNKALQDQEFSGLDSRMRIMVERMKSMNEVSKDEPIPDRILFDTHLPHFTGKVAVNFTNCGKLTDEEACKNCVSWVVLYCKAQTAHIMLLTVIIAAFKSSGRETKFIERQLETAKAESREKLAFLSNEMQMRKKSRQSRSHTLLAIYVRRSNLAYRVIEGFRESLGIEKMPPLNKIGLIALEARHCYPEDVTHRYARPHAWQGADCHYFQLINHTEFPILVKCGNGVGKKVNLLKFTGKLKPYSSYEHAATTKFNRTFSTGGVFVVFFEDQERSEENMLENDGSRMKVFEFALSKPLFGKDKSAILDMSEDFSPATNGQNCWKEMKKGTVSNSPIYFEVDGLPYIAFTSYSTRGSNRSQTCRFVVQNYNPLEMHLTLDRMQSFYENPEDVSYEQLDTEERPPAPRSFNLLMAPQGVRRVQFTSDSNIQEIPKANPRLSDTATESITLISSSSDEDDSDSTSSHPSAELIVLCSSDKTNEKIKRFPFSHTKHLVGVSLTAFFIVLLFVIYSK